ncbi:MAG TPA: hypothetical protein PKV28_03840, partial [Methanothrix sp.]|nr:hypothetical protein [Methanothrix sp.]
MSLSSAAISYREPAVKIQFKTDASLPAATSDNNGQDRSIEERDSSIAGQGVSSSIAKKSTPTAAVAGKQSSDRASSSIAKKSTPTAAVAGKQSSDRASSSIAKKSTPTAAVAGKQSSDRASSSIA